MNREFITKTVSHLIWEKSPKVESLSASVRLFQQRKRKKAEMSLFEMEEEGGACCYMEVPDTNSASTWRLFVQQETVPAVHGRDGWCEKILLLFLFLVVVVLVAVVVVWW